MLRLLSLLALGIALVGCDNTSGTNIDVQRNGENSDKKGGVKVNAPGVNVDIERKDGNSDRKGRVKVKAPGVDVDVERKND